MDPYPPMSRRLVRRVSVTRIIIVAHEVEAKVLALRTSHFIRCGRPQPSSLGDYPNSRYAEPVANKTRDGGTTAVPRQHQRGLRLSKIVLRCRHSWWLCTDGSSPFLARAVGAGARFGTVYARSFLWAYREESIRERRTSPESAGWK